VLDCPRIHVMAGLIPSNTQRGLLRSTYTSRLRWAAEQAAAAGKELLIEPINVRDMPGYLLNRQEDAHAIVEEIGMPNLKVQMDLYHCALVEGDVALELERYLGGPRRAAVGHMQIAGVPGRHEPTSGSLDFDFLFDRIEALGFDGWIGLEYHPSAGTSAGLSWLRRQIARSLKTNAVGANSRP
jgi:hydroxypyruvate isomerase